MSTFLVLTLRIIRRYEAQLQGPWGLLDTFHHRIEVNPHTTLSAGSAAAFTARACADGLQGGALHTHQFVSHIQQAVRAGVEGCMVLALDHDAFHSRHTHLL